MTNIPTIFVYVTASDTAKNIPSLIHQCVQAGWTVYTIASPNVAMVMPLDDLFAVPNCHPIRAYGDPPLDRFPFGTMLVAPCTFNTMNKLAHGFADSLGTAMMADALGRGCPMFIAPSMNVGLWQHPQTQVSLQRLQAWACYIVGPQVEANTVQMVHVSEIFTRHD